jgi:nickel-type superoxide dismutase maturation protease
MLPVLRPGSLVIAYPINSRTRLVRGDVVVARRPDRPSVEMVKRISEIDGDHFYLLGDNPNASTDSRTFGAVDRSQLIARVTWRYWPLPPRRLRT